MDSFSSGANGVYQNSAEDFHSNLNKLGEIRFAPASPLEQTDWYDAAEIYHNLRLHEYRFLESERQNISHLAAEAPTGNSQQFIAWFEDLKHSGPGQGDALFPWLEQHANRDEMRWFVKQEVAGEAGFEDLLALTQLGMPVQAKLEMAHNYWDEMGRGKRKGMHGPMLASAADELGIDQLVGSGLVWESQALANLMVGLASNRPYAYHSVGALGVIELTAPSRTKYVAEGLKRLNLSKHGYLYFALHSSVDIQHSKDWNREVICSLVDQHPDNARYIAEGALMRLNAGARCFARYREHFQL